MSKSPATVAHRNPIAIDVKSYLTTNPDGTITLHIPINFKRHGGRKYIIAPGGTASEASVPKDSILKALGRAFHYQALLANDPTLTHEALSRKLGFGGAYVSKIMHLTLLAPDVIDAILDGNYPKYLSVADIQKAGWEWEAQRRLFAL